MYDVGPLFLHFVILGLKFVLKNAADPLCSVDFVLGFILYFVKSIFRACARLVLGVEFHRLQETEEPRFSFNTAINIADGKLKNLPSGEMFTVLQWLMVNYWSHATLVAMMKGDDMDQTQGMMGNNTSAPSLYFIHEIIFRGM